MKGGLWFPVESEVEKRPTYSRKTVLRNFGVSSGMLKWYCSLGSSGRTGLNGSMTWKGYATERS
jgi:hypothetical protein